MKKLTAGIFATILGVTAMGAADAAVTSKSYVDAAVGTVAQSVTNLGTTVENTYATKQALGTAKDTLQDNIDAVALVANAAATKAEVGTPDEGKTVVGMIKAVEANAYDDKEVRGLITGNATAIQGLETNKADKSTTYTKTETDGLLGAKANAAELAKVATTGAYADLDGKPDLSDMATKTEVASTYATKTDINGMATQTWVGEQNYVDETELAGKGYLTSTSLTDYATKAEAKGYANAKDEAIAEAKQAGTAAAAVAAENAKDIAALETEAATYELKANVSGAPKNVANGKYVLTMITDGNGAVTGYGWELIDRDYVPTEVTGNGQ